MKNIVIVFAIFDEKAEAFLAPFTFPAVGQAVRAFSDLINDESPRGMYRHHADYNLYELGELDICSGEFTNRKRFIVGGVSLMEPRHDPNQMSLLEENGDGETAE